jgi:hypothetical protein
MQSFAWWSDLAEFWRHLFDNPLHSIYAVGLCLVVVLIATVLILWLRPAEVRKLVPKRDGRFGMGLFEFLHRWGALMSGAFSVPFAFASLFADQQRQKIIWGIMAVGAILVSYYVDHRKQKGRIKELEARLSPKIYASCEILDAQEGPFPRRYVQVVVRPSTEGNLENCEVMLHAVTRLDQLSKGTRVYNQALNACWSGISDRAITIAAGQKRSANLFSVSIDHCLRPETQHQDLALGNAVSHPADYLLDVVVTAKDSAPKSCYFILRWGGTLHTTDIVPAT